MQNISGKEDCSVGQGRDLWRGYRRWHRSRRFAFTLIEVVAALMILTIIVTTVVIIMNNCISTVGDCRLEMRCFEIARENMEKLLASSTVSDMAKYGADDFNPDIEWQTLVQSFYEPVSSRMWIQAVCTAWYTDSNNQRQSVELVHWLTDVTKQQMEQILRQQKEQSEYMDQAQYEEYIGDYQKAVMEYLEESGIEPGDYDELVGEQKKERIAWLKNNPYDKEIYNRLTADQREIEEQVLKKIGVDIVVLDRWIAVNVPSLIIAPGGSYSGADGGASKPGSKSDSKPDTKPGDKPSTGPDTGASSNQPPSEEEPFDWSKVPDDLVPVVEALLGQKKPQK